MAMGADTARSLARFLVVLENSTFCSTLVSCEADEPRMRRVARLHYNYNAAAIGR